MFGLENGGGMMRVEVQLQGPLQKYGRAAGFFKWETAAGHCMIKELLGELGIPASSVSFATVDGSKQCLDFKLQGEERVVVYPRVAGG